MATTKQIKKLERIALNKYEDLLDTILVLEAIKAQTKLGKEWKELKEKGLQSSNGKSLENAPKIFRKRVGRLRILFTVKLQVINVWIVAIEKDTDKDYKRWIDYITSQ